MNNDTSKARRYYCAGAHCPGYAWKASESAHPWSCVQTDERTGAYVAPPARAVGIDCVYAHEDTPIPFVLTDKAMTELAEWLQSPPDWSAPAAEVLGRTEPGRTNVADTLRSAANIAIHYERPELASLILNLASRISESEASR